MNRRKDWVTRLDAYFKRSASKPFDWPSHNCLTFGMGAVTEQTGTDPLASWRALAPWNGEWTTRQRAYAMIRKFAGSDDLGAVVSKLLTPLGAEEVPPGLARRGDLVLFPTAEGPAVGIVDLSGRGIKGLHPVQGFSYAPVQHATRAWRIG